MEVFDWLANMESPSRGAQLDRVEVRFKNGRKGFYKNAGGFQLYMGESVVVAGAPGFDIGQVSLTGELVRVQMRKKGVSLGDSDIRKIYRIATERDLEIWDRAKGRERETMLKSRTIASGLGLEMKISDVEYQGDGTKATFYYTAAGRVDFRELIKALTGCFGVRVEMKQIGHRQEAARLGGLGSCGRELCCSTWLNDFRSVTTAAARYQQLSINPQKLAGQCGKLKCCLNYELDAYLDVLKRLPNTNVVLQTEKGNAVIQKLDVFRELFWYAYEDELLNWVKLTATAVAEIISRNEKGEKAVSLAEFAVDETSEIREFENAVGRDEYDPPFKTRRTHPKRQAYHHRNKPNSRNGKSR